MKKVIAIDGPSGSGKSTLAKMLASKLGVTYIDTGAMFRALGWHCHHIKLDLQDSQALKETLSNVDIEYAPKEGVLIKINGKDLTEKIREHEVSQMASSVSGLPEIRQFLLEFQRGLADEKICLMEGRDIGTVVFPEAFIKFFITASPEVRAKRRLDQLVEAGDTSFEFDQILADVIERDKADSERALAPLKQADDAILIDSSEMDLDSVLNKLSEKTLERANKLGLSL